MRCLFCNDLKFCLERKSGSYSKYRCKLYPKMKSLSNSCRSKSILFDWNIRKMSVNDLKKVKSSRFATWMSKWWWNFPFLVNKKVKVCDVLSRGSMDVVCSVLGSIVLMLFHICRYTNTHICSGVFFSSSFLFWSLFLYSGMLLPSQTLKHTWLRRCVCGWVERVLQCFHLRVTQNPSPVLYHLHLCVCVSCVRACVHVCMHAQGQPHMPP